MKNPPPIKKALGRAGTLPDEESRKQSRVGPRLCWGHDLYLHSPRSMIHKEIKRGRCEEPYSLPPLEDGAYILCS